MFVPNEYQQKVIDAVKGGIGNIIVNALAGAGKTQTIVSAVDNVPKGSKVLFVAFNASIVKEIRARIAHPDEVDVFTYHALGKRILEKTFKEMSTSWSCQIDPLKYKSFINLNAEKLAGPEYKLLSPSAKRKYINNIVNIVDFARYNMMQSEKEMKKVCIKYDILPVLNECQAAVKVLRWGFEYRNEIDYPDMVWMVAEGKFRHPFFMYDYIFIDEAQDSSPAQQALFSLCLKSNGRCIMVGDENQCINAWCGADTAAFQTLGEMPNTKKFILPESFRISKSVARMAQTIVPEIRARVNAPEGSAGFMVNVSNIKEGDMVLCRTTEPLIRLLNIMLKQGKKAYIMGRRFGTDIYNKMKETGEKKISANLEEEGVIPKLYYDLFCTMESKAKMNHITYNDTIELPEVLKMIDLINAAISLSDGLNDPEDVWEKVGEFFFDPNDGSDESDDGRSLNPETHITLATIHGSKGLESRNVFLLCPSLLPSPLARTEEELWTERNLEYVAITRAKENYYKLFENDVKPTSTWNNRNDLSSSLKKIRERIEEIYGEIKPEITKEEKEIMEKKLKVSGASLDNVTRPIIKNNKPKKAPKFKKFI